MVLELSESSQKYIGDICSKVKLKEHQLSAIYRCVEMENNRLLSNTDDYEYMYSNIGILGDAPGSGKSYIILGLIQANIEPRVQLKNISTYMNQFSFMYKNKLTSDFRVENTNLIVCPTSCVRQWTTYINTFYENRMSSFKVTRINHFQEFVNKNKVYDIILVNSTNYSRIAKYYNENRIKINRVIFDEVDNANTPGAKKIEANFYWLLSATYENILYPFPRYETYYDDFGYKKYYTLSTGILQNIFVKDIFLNVLKLNSSDVEAIHNNLIVKNEDRYVKASFDVPELMKTIIKCKAPLVLNVLNGLTSENVIKCLNAGDMNTAIKELKIRNVNTETHIIDIIMRNLKDELRNKQLILKCTQEMWFDSTETQTERIQALKDQIQNIEDKIETLLQRLVDNSMCSICYLEIDDGKIITPCCKNSFCLACLVKWTQYKNNCPTCRHNPFNLDEMFVIRPDINIVNNNHIKTEELLDKFVEFEKIIVKMNTKKCKVLIFSEYNDTLEKIEKILCNNKINSLTLQDKGINSKIDKYKTDENFNILLINSRYFGCGINLELTTDIILFHKFDTSLEKQVLGRAQRPGRKSPLNVWYLLNENELKNNL